MEFLDIRTLKAASLVNRDFNYGAHRLICQSFYIRVDPRAYDVDLCGNELRRVKEGCAIACAGTHPKRIRKFTLTFRKYSSPPVKFQRTILEMVFGTLRQLTGLRHLELDLGWAVWDGDMDGFMSTLIRGSLPFQLERFAFTKPWRGEIVQSEFQSEFLLSQQSITTLSINFPPGHAQPPPQPRSHSGEWDFLENRPITHLFAELIYNDEVIDLFGSLSQSTTTLQLLWLRTPRSYHPDAFSQSVTDPTATTLVSNLRYLVLETFQGGNIRVLSLFSNLEELVMDLRSWWLTWDPRDIEIDFFEASKSCPRLRKAVLFLYDGPSIFVTRFYRRLGAQEDWELMSEDRGLRGRDEREPLTGRRHQFPGMPY